MFGQVKGSNFPEETERHMLFPENLKGSENESQVIPMKKVEQTGLLCNIKDLYTDNHNVQINVKSFPYISG